MKRKIYRSIETPERFPELKNHHRFAICKDCGRPFLKDGENILCPACLSEEK